MFLGRENAVVNTFVVVNVECFWGLVRIGEGDGFYGDVWTEVGDLGGHHGS